jgi:hypothetical protein
MSLKVKLRRGRGYYVEDFGEASENIKNLENIK